MKGLKKVALASAVAAISAGAQAELTALDDAALGELTGQAGLTIDVETKYTIGEFMYKDAGSLFLTGISLGGNENTNPGGYLDNFRMYIDISDGTLTSEGYLSYGFSRVSELAAFHVAAGNADAGMQAAAAAVLTSTPGASTDVSTGLAVDDRKLYDDGDLVIHFTFNDAWQAGGGFNAYGVGSGSDGAGGTAGFDTLTFATARDIATRAVDFNFSIDAIGIADSTFTAGDSINTAGNPVTDVYQGGVAADYYSTGIDSDTTTTVLISQLSMNGYLGPADLHIENNGNGFGADGSGNGGVAGSGNADSKITWGSYFKITDLDIYIDIAGVWLKDVRIENSRGDLSGLDGTSSFGFAHSERTIYAVKDSVLDVGNVGQASNPDHRVDGLALNTRFKGDIDIGAIEFGDTGESIGSIYLTDIDSDTKWTISAH